MSKNKKFHYILRFIFCAVAVSASAYSCFAQQGYEYDSQGKRDPFIPLVTPDGRFQKLEAGDKSEKNDENLKLNGIIYDKYGISYAIVNDIVVKTGDSIGDFIVLKIDMKKVTFIREGQITEIFIKKED